MRARILPMDEWHRLEPGSRPDFLQYAEPENVAVCVVEDSAGKIVGVLCAVQVTHLEGTWVAPEHRKKGSVLRSLLRQAYAVPQLRGERWAFGSVQNANDEVLGYLERMGGRQMPVAIFALPTGEH